MNEKIKATVLIIRQDGYFFCGEGSLVEEPHKAKVFTDLDEIFERIRDAIDLGTSPVLQVRIIGTNANI